MADTLIRKSHESVTRRIAELREAQSNAAPQTSPSVAPGAISGSAGAAPDLVERLRHIHAELATENEKLQQQVAELNEQNNDLCRSDKDWGNQNLRLAGALSDAKAERDNMRNSIADELEFGMHDDDGHHIQYAKAIRGK